MAVLYGASSVDNPWLHVDSFQVSCGYPYQSDRLLAWPSWYFFYALAATSCENVDLSVKVPPISITGGRHIGHSLS